MSIEQPFDNYSGWRALMQDLIVDGSSPVQFFHTRG